jgi:16S rRNA C1402 N4-methylase RsmH
MLEEVAEHLALPNRICVSAPALSPAAGGLAAASARYYVDGTCGTGGHARALLVADPAARVLCIDRDAAALEAAVDALSPQFGSRVAFWHGSFADLDAALTHAAANAGWPSIQLRPAPAASDGESKVGLTGVLLDLGLGSHQLDDPARGFSFQQDGPLDMRYAAAAGATPPAPTTATGQLGRGAEEQAPAAAAATETATAGAGLTASDIVSKWSGPQLEALFTTYGDEPRARDVARAVLAWRSSGDRRRKIVSTLELRYAIEQYLALVDEATAAASASAAAATSTTGATLDPGPLRSRDKLTRWPSPAARARTLAKVRAAKSVYPMVLRRVFQALRIAVNDEFGHLARGLAAATVRLAPGGRLAVIAFQPAEDAATKAVVDAATTSVRP